MTLAFIAGAMIGGLFGACMALSYARALQRNLNEAYDLVKHEYLGMLVEQDTHVRKFADEVLEMLNMYSDDDNEIYIKKRVLEVNMKSILEDYV